MSAGCVKIAGRKNRTPLLRSWGLERTGVRGSSWRAPAIVTTLLRMCWKAWTMGLAVRPAYGSADMSEKAEGEGDGG